MRSLKITSETHPAESQAWAVAARARSRHPLEDALLEVVPHAAQGDAYSPSQGACCSPGEPTGPVAVSRRLTRGTRPPGKPLPRAQMTNHVSLGCTAVRPANKITPFAAFYTTSLRFPPRRVLRRFEIALGVLPPANGF